MQNKTNEYQCFLKKKDIVDKQSGFEPENINTQL